MNRLKYERFYMFEKIKEKKEQERIAREEEKKRIKNELLEKDNKELLVMIYLEMREINNKLDSLEIIKLNTLS
ncbi:MAG: hypothetical protein IJS58_06730 [Bacilli bacterium]|nr:hypothetical protein [Bacilli bacterium]